MLNRLGIKSQFAAGLRITDAATIEIVEMVLAKHHLDDLDGGGVGDAQPGRDLRLDAQPVEHLADLRAAAVHDHRIDGGLLHQHDVAGEALAISSSPMACPPYFTTTISSS